MLQIVWVWGACLAVGVLLVRTAADQLVGSARLTAVGLVATAALIAVHLLPGMLTILTPVSVAVTAGLALAGSIALSRRRRGVRADREAPPASATSSPLSVALASVATLALGAQATAYFWANRAMPPSNIDLNGIHLPVVVRWIQTHSIWGNHEWVPYYAAGNYPQNVDIPYLSTMLPLHQDVFARWSVLPWYGLLGLAIFAVAREFGASKASSMLIAVVTLSVRIIASTTIAEGLGDVQMFACTAAGALFLIRQHRTGLRSDLAISGLGLGIAMGGKWYGLSTVVALMLAWILVRTVNTRRVREIARDSVSIVGWICLFGTIWLIRNWVSSGNPLTPLSIHPLGIKIFTAPHDPIITTYGQTIGGYLGDGNVMRDTIIPALRHAVGIPGAVLLGLGAAAAVLWVDQARRKASPPPAVAIALLGAFICTAIYLATPYSALGPQGAPVEPVVFANTRYLVPAFLLAAGPAAWLISRLPSIARCVAEVAMAAIVVSVTRTSVLDPAAPVKPPHVLAFGALLVLLAAGALVARRLTPRALWRPAIVLGTTVILVGGIAEARRVQRSESVGRYSTEPGIAALQKFPGHPTLGMVGNWYAEGISMTYPAFGPRLDTNLRTIGHYDHGVLRPPTRAEFQNGLRSGRYDALVVGLFVPPLTPTPPYLAWARAVGWQVAVHDKRTALLFPSGIAG